MRVLEHFQLGHVFYCPGVDPTSRGRGNQQQDPDKVGLASAGSPKGITDGCNIIGRR
jgi:hypothetical protein